MRWLGTIVASSFTGVALTLLVAQFVDNIFIWWVAMLAGTLGSGYYFWDPVVFKMTDNERPPADGR